MDLENFGVGSLWCGYQHLEAVNVIEASRVLYSCSLRSSAPTVLTKSPIVLEAEGLGAKTFHGRVAVLVDRHTASAALLR